MVCPTPGLGIAVKVKAVKIYIAISHTINLKSFIRSLHNLQFSCNLIRVS